MRMIAIWALLLYGASFAVRGPSLGMQPKKIVDDARVAKRVFPGG